MKQNIVTYSSEGRAGGEPGLAAFETARTEIDRYGYRMDTFFESGTRNGDIPLLKKGVQGWIHQLKEHPS